MFSKKKIDFRNPSFYHRVRLYFKYSFKHSFLMRPIMWVYYTVMLRKELNQCLKHLTPIWRDKCNKEDFVYAGMWEKDCKKYGVKSGGELEELIAMVIDVSKDNGTS